MLTVTPIEELISVQSLMYIQIHVKRLLLLWDFRHHWNDLTNFSKNLKYQFFKNVCPAGAKMFHSDTP